MSLPAQRAHLRGRAARRAAERSEPIVHRRQARVHLAAASPPACPRSRRRASSRRGRSRSSPTRTSCCRACRRARRRSLSGPRAQQARPGPRRGRRRRRHGRLHRGERRLHAAQHRHDRRRARWPRSSRCSPRRRELRLVEARLRLDGVRLPVHRARSTRPGSWRSPAAARAGRRRDLPRRHDRRRRPAPGPRRDRGADSRPASRSTGSPTTSTTRAARRWPT